MAHGEAQFLCMNAKTWADCTRKAICYWKRPTSTDAEIARPLPKLEATGHCMAYGEAQFLCMNRKTEAECIRRGVCHWKNATSADAEVALEMPSLKPRVTAWHTA